MKKLISLMLVLALCLMGGAFAEALDVTGVWYLNVIESDGMQLDPAMVGMEMTITLNADGSAAVENMGEADPRFTWEMDGETVVITDNAGVAMPAVMDEDGNMVILEEELGMTMILGREKTAIETYVPAPVEEEPALADFEGTWNAALIDMMGIQVSMEALEMKLQIEIAGTNALVTSNESGEEMSYNAPVHLEGDTLTVESMSEQMPMELQLQQDGKVVCTEENEGMIISIFFEKIA